MAKLQLTVALGDYDRTSALRTGLVCPEGVELNVLTLSPEEMFYRMGRFREFDVSEFSLSTYTIRRGRGEPLIAIPVFPSRMFRHSSVYVRDGAGIAEPGDLRGKRMGVPKYHMTAAVWIRGLLEDDYGVAPKDMRWVEGDDAFPYGIARNRANIEALVGHSVRQGLAPRRLAIPEMFVESLLDT
jgi:4,5-dihydroxyphthalate decarboxylase